MDPATKTKVAVCSLHFCRQNCGGRREGPQRREETEHLEVINRPLLRIGSIFAQAINFGGSQTGLLFGFRNHFNMFHSVGMDCWYLESAIQHAKAQLVSQ